MAAVGDIDDTQDIILISSAGIVIRIPSDSVSTYARTAKGVRVMRLDEQDTLVNMTYAEHEEEAPAEEEAAETEEPAEE